jgi:hypothetical protein
MPKLAPGSTLKGDELTTEVEDGPMGEKVFGSRSRPEIAPHRPLGCGKGNSFQQEIMYYTLFGLSSEIQKTTLLTVEKNVI